MPVSLLCFLRNLFSLLFILQYKQICHFDSFSSNFLSNTVKLYVVRPITTKQKDTAFNDKWTGKTMEFYGGDADVWWNRLELGNTSGATPTDF